MISTKTYVVGNQKDCLNETVLLSTQNINSFHVYKILLRFTRIPKIKIIPFTRNYTAFYTSNRGFAVTTIQQQTSFIMRNNTPLKLLYLKRKNEIGIYTSL